MDSESDCSVHETVEDNEGIEEIGEPKVQSDRSCIVENGDFCNLFSEMNGEKTAVLGSFQLPIVEKEPGVSPSNTVAKKGTGLKKWRRIKREVNESGNRIFDTNNTRDHDLSPSGVHSSKRMQFFHERKEQSESSVSPTNSIVRNLNGFIMLEDSGLNFVSPFTAGTNLENSNDAHDTSNMRGLSGNNLTQSGQRGQQLKSRVEITKKAREDLVKIEKENSHSSVDSDSRSSNFVFMQGTQSSSNGIQSERSIGYDGENGNEVQGYSQNGDFSPEDAGADVAKEVKEERDKNHTSDLLSESMFALQSAQEELQKEVLKFKEIGKDISIEDPVHDFPQELQETSSGDVETHELEDLFKQKIQAEVEYLAISRTVKNLSAAAVDNIAILREQKNLVSEQNKILHQLEDNETKAAHLKKEAEKLETFCEEISSANETLKLQKKVHNYTLCFLVQLVSLVGVLGIFFFEISTNQEVVPT